MSVAAIYHFCAASEVGLVGAGCAHLKAADFKRSFTFYQDGDNSDAIMAS
jgi:hypothetical protein